MQSPMVSAMKQPPVRLQAVPRREATVLSRCHYRRVHQAPRVSQKGQARASQLLVSSSSVTP